MTLDAPPSELRAWITEHLDPLEDFETPASHSDYDLNLPARPSVSDPLTPAAVLVGLVERTSGLSVILTRRSDNLRRHTGQVALPGGRRDPGETPWDTALREAHEEIGLEPEYVSVAGLMPPYQTGTGYLITPVVGFVRPGFSLSPNPDEVATAPATDPLLPVEPGVPQPRILMSPGPHTPNSAFFVQILTQRDRY